MAHFKDTTVHLMVPSNEDQIHWDPSLLRSADDCKEESACNLLAKLTGVEVVPQGNDELVWPHGPKGFSTNKSFCSALHNRSSYFDFPLAAI